MNDHLAQAYLGNYRSGGRDTVRSKVGPSAPSTVSLGQRKNAKQTARGGSSGTRTVAKANYFRVRGGSAKAATSLRYYATRKNLEKVIQERDIFTKADDKVPFADAARQLTKLCQDERFEQSYRIILSPDAARDTSAEAIKEWTRSVMSTLERNHKVAWFAVAHSEANGHTAHAHVHIVAMLDTRLSKDEFASLRHNADVYWQDIMTRQKTSEKDHYVHHRYGQDQQKSQHTQSDQTKHYSSGLEL